MSYTRSLAKSAAVSGSRLVRSGILCGALVLLATSTFITPANAIIWDGSQSTDWLDPNNWQGGTIPVAGNLVDLEPGNPFSPVIGIGTNISLPGSSIYMYSGSSLTIQDGGTITNYTGYITGGNALVTGSGSQWIISGGTLDVLGGGVLTIADGAFVSATQIIRTSDGSGGSTSSVVVTGAGSTLTTPGPLYIGINAEATFTVSNGGLVSSDSGVIGEFEDSLVNVLITGSGSRWLNATTLQVGSGFYGSGGNGILTIADGGLVEADSITLGLFLPSTGRVTVTGSGSLLQSATAIIVGDEGFGSLTLADNGVVSAGSNSILVANQAGSVGELNIGAPTGSAPVAPGSTTVSSIVFGAGDGRVVFNHTSSGLFFPQTISGAGAVDIRAGVTELSVANTYTGATTIYGGSLRAGMVDNFNQASVHDVRANGTLDLAGYDQTLPTVLNGGKIVTGGTPGTLFTVQTYVGNGGALVLNTVLNGNASPSDRLVITGSATGLSSLHINNIGGSGALTSGDGILVIEASNGGTTTANAFHLGNRVAAGAYEYNLYRGGASGSDNWYLRSDEDIVIVDPDTGLPEVVEVPDYRVEVPLIASITPVAMEYGFSMLGTLHERVGDTWIAPLAPAYEERTVRDRNGRETVVRVPATTSVSRTSWFSGAWGRLIGDRGFRNNDNFARRGPDYDYTFAGIQTGLDVFGHERADGTLDKLGIYVGYGQIDANEKGTYGGKAGTIDADAYTVGTYWTHKAAAGWYTDAVVQGTWYSVDARSIYGQRFKPDGFGVIASLETGYAFQVGYGFTLEPQAQLAYQNVSFGDVADAYGRFSLSDGESLRGRLGMRLSKSWNMADTLKPRMLTTWLRTNVWHEFMGDSSTTVSGFGGENPLTVNSSLGGTWAEIGAGVSGQVDDNVALFATGAYNRSIDNRGREAWNGRLGVTVKW